MILDFGSHSDFGMGIVGSHNFEVASEDSLDYDNSVESNAGKVFAGS